MDKIEREGNLIEEEVDIECQEFKFNGITYLIDTATNKVYSTEGEEIPDYINYSKLTFPIS